jgi:hypothetical protein
MWLEEEEGKERFEERRGEGVRGDRESMKERGVQQ